MKKINDKCENCGRQLTHNEMMLGTCSECFQLVINELEKMGEIEVFTGDDGIPRVKLTEKGRKIAMKEK